MADASERIIILTAVLLVVIFIRSTQLHSKEPIYEIKIEIPENASIGMWDENPILRDVTAWITATVLTVEPSPLLNIIVLSSEEKDIPSSLFKAIDKTLPEDESVYEGEQITDVPTGERRLAISIVEAESIIHYFGEELEKDRLYYEYYVNYVDSIFSVLIQFHLPDPTS